MRYRANPEILRLLESAYADYHSHFHRGQDPVSLVHRYTDPRDREVAAFVTSLLSYGNVRTILNSVAVVLDALGPVPHQSVRELAFRKLPTFRHRFTTGEDMEIILTWLSRALQSHGTLEAFFTDSRHPTDAPMKDLLSDFVIRFTSQPLPEALASRLPARERNLKYLLSDPSRGSACKRLNMFLRWMVRAEDGIDLGLWRTLRADQLMLPVDTHLLQTLRALRWTRSKQATWKVAEEATARLKLYAPTDPIRYDFALCHLSMCGGNVLHYRKGRDEPTLER